MKSKSLNKEKIVYRKEDGLLYIQIPYFLKDQFKGFFRTAKWDSSARRWTISENKRNIRKIETFIETVKNSHVLDTNDQKEELEASIDEIELLKSELFTINNDIELKISELEEIKAEKTSLGLLQEELENKKNTLEKYKIALEKEEKEGDELFKKSKKIISSVIDINELDNIRNELLILMSIAKERGFLYAQQKDEFRKNQSKLKVIRGKLMEIGLISDALDHLYAMNINRPDRDDPSLISIEKIMVTMRKISE